MLASVPNEGQSFVRLTVDTQADLATMTFLGRDLQTVFSVVPCPTGNPIQFLFNYGFVYSNSIIFLVDPGPPPYGIYWHYSVSYSTNSLQIYGIRPQQCRGAVGCRAEHERYGVFEGGGVAIYSRPCRLDECG